MANFGAAYAATQETVKSQSDSLAAIQAQLAGLQQFCMAIGQQQPPPNNIYYAPQQQQRRHNNSRKKPQRQRRWRLQWLWQRLPTTTNLAPRPTKRWPWVCASHALQAV
jgi:hypothetical protein